VPDVEPAADFHRGDGKAALALFSQLADLYQEAYAEPPYHSGPLFDADAFEARTRRQATRDGFTIVWAETNGRVVGFAFGFMMPAGGWWAGQAATPPDRVVARAWRGHGIGRRLLDELLSGRPESFAILTAVRDAPARAMYARWGWEQVGTAQHTTDAPVMDQLVLRLPAAP
jgi:GNAT superfamily N-acetyltransferase